MRIPNVLTMLFFSVLMFPLAAPPVAAQDLEVYEDIEDEMQEIRELDLTEPLDITFMTRDEFVASLEASPESEEDEGANLDDRRTLVAFGFIDADMDPDEIYTGLLGEQVAGFYDPSTKEMVVILSNEGDEPSVLDLVTFAHETVHAIQDQNFDLGSYDEMRLDGTDDTYLAVTALIEGDATLAQIDYLLDNPDVAADYLAALDNEDFDSDALDSAPPIFVATLSFPYNQGFEFAQALYDEGGWILVNEGYENPPTTSEQILHPDKYLDGEVAVEVEVPDIERALGDDWREFETNSYGEFIISILLDDADLTSRQVDSASSGWGGDAYVAVTNETDTAITWVTAWDTVDDADEFFRALVVRESGRLDAEVEREGNTITISGDDQVVQIIREGETVTWLSGPNLDVVETMGAELNPTEQSTHLASCL